MLCDRQRLMSCWIVFCRSCVECHLASDDKSQGECSEKCKSVDATVSTAEGLYTQSLFFVSSSGWFLKSQLLYLVEANYEESARYLFHQEFHIWLLFRFVFPIFFFSLINSLFIKILIEILGRFLETFKGIGLNSVALNNILVIAPLNKVNNLKFFYNKLCWYN